MDSRDRSAWLYRFLFADSPLNLQVGVWVEAIGSVSGEQFVKHHAKRVNVRAVGKRFSPDLLRTGVVWGS